MFELSVHHLLFAAVGAVIIVAHWLPRFVSGREPAASALLILLGWAVFAWVPDLSQTISPLSEPGVWEAVSEVCLIVSLFGVGLRIDRLTNLANWRPTIGLLVIGMPLTILGVALVGWQVAGLTLAGGLLLGSILAPTDPVLASDLQVGRPKEGGEHPVRFTLTTEAGLNDGLAFPFVHLALLIAGAAALTPELFAAWAARDLLWRITVGVLCGLVLGWFLGKVLFDWPRRNALAETGAGVVALAGVLLTYGLTELLEGYGFIAAFVAGLILRRADVEHHFHVRLHDFSESIEHALMAFLMIALGAALPALLRGLDMAGAIVALGLIFVIRPAAGLLSLAGARLGLREKGVVAFYGVRGVGSIYYLAYAGGHAQLDNEAQLWAIAALTILISTVLHGLSAAFALEKATGEQETQEEKNDTGVIDACGNDRGPSA